MNRKSPTRRNIHAILNLAEEYAEILRLRERIEAVASRRPAAGRQVSHRVDDDPLSSKKARKRN
jgi:hypothetical protein